MTNESNLSNRNSAHCKREYTNDFKFNQRTFISMQRVQMQSERHSRNITVSKDFERKKKKEKKGERERSHARSVGNQRFFRSVSTWVIQSGLLIVIIFHHEKYKKERMK
eukprot:TRINITY_DN9710_c0_g1_i1.p2 TRINITY_DN9710_c0_g1~~TRINITY_DN9710_c0_g1_i1.p2  ORF type:complete len:109 (-),score=22.89 TRINITY_DN9710_c0_g1_i1:992-1318(-)